MKLQGDKTEYSEETQRQEGLLNVQTPDYIRKHSNWISIDFTKLQDSARMIRNETKDQAIRM